jgi:hypothetical protein
MGWMKNQRECARCHRSFWAWETPRRCCYLCEPRPIEDTLVLQAIHTEPYNAPPARAVWVPPLPEVAGLPLVPGGNGRGR